MAFQPSKSKKNLTKESGTLNMNSMMDMMTIILLFLLKSFSTEGALVTPSEELRLPQSQQGERPKKELNVAVAKDHILVNDVLVATKSDIKDDVLLIEPLRQKLMEYARKEIELQNTIGKEFTHQVNIQGDEKTHFDVLFKVMFTCSKSDFYKMRLLTIKSGA